MSGVFAGGHALVTGASRGIGQAIAHMFAREGARVSCAASRAQNAAGTSVIDRAGAPEASQDDTPATPSLPSAEDLLPPSDGDNAPLVPRAD